MIDRAIIMGVRRGDEIITAREIQQMAGRCGRSNFLSGEVILIVPKADTQIAEQLLNGTPEPVQSQMKTIENIAFHVIPNIANYEATYSKPFNSESFNKWFQRTLAYNQGFRIDWNTIKTLLQETQCLNEDDLLSTSGKVSQDYCLLPTQVWNLKEKLECLVGIEEWSIYQTAWLLAFTRKNSTGFKLNALENFQSNANSNQVYFNDDTLIEGYAYSLMIQPYPPIWSKSLIAELQRGIGRLFGALQALSWGYKLEVGNNIPLWYTCFKRTLPVELGRVAIKYPDLDNRYLRELESLGILDCTNREIFMNRINQEGSRPLRKYFESRML